MSSTGTTRNVLAFDIYGTLLNTGSVGVALQSLLNIDEEQASTLCLLWRRYQLEYTWRLNSMGVHEPFDVVTSSALQHALSELGHKFDERLIVQIMAAYSRLKEFDDAVATMKELQRLPNVEVVVFSNGTEDMVTKALEVGSESLSTLTKRMFLVNEVQAYKPSPATYNGLLNYVNSGSTQQASGQNVWLVSGNPFDVAGARSAGLQAIWVDRPGTGWVDRASAHKPSKIVRSLGEIVDFIQQM